MAIIGSDFHGNLDKVKKFLSYKPKEQHVFAGDILDSYTESDRDILTALRMLMDSNCVLIYGNHEISYLYSWMRASGYRHSLHQIVNPLLRKRHRWKWAYCVDDFLVTHAGLTSYYEGNNTSAQGMTTKLVRQGNIKQPIVFGIGQARGGTKVSGGILWYDYKHDYTVLSERFNQVFGHTPSKEPYVKHLDNGKMHVCINTLDGSPDLYVFDTTTKEVNQII